LQFKSYLKTFRKPDYQQSPENKKFRAFSFYRILKLGRSQMQMDQEMIRNYTKSNDSSLLGIGKIGFVGFGHMGSTMLRALLINQAIPQDKVIIFTRTQEKIKGFITDYPEVEVAGSLTGLGQKSGRVFICTGTREVKPVLTELAGYLPGDSHVISITGTIEMICLESIFGGRISKIMPTMISEVGEGVTLVCHNSRVTPEDKEFIHSAFGKIGRVKEIREDQVDLAADLTSCAPAFFAAIIHHFTDAAGKHGDFNENEIKNLILPTCYGTAKLLLNCTMDYEGLISRVATKGGISEEGVKILDRRLPEAFNELLTVTLEKRLKTKKLMREQYGLD
jgi:pyrroline-5-carboxylate reductase